MKLFSSKKEEIRSTPPFLIEGDDLMGDLAGKKGTSLFLGKHSIQEVETVLRKRNFYREAKKRNLWPLEYTMDSSNFPPLQRLQIFYQTKQPDNLVVDLKIREGRLRMNNPDVLVQPLPESNYLVLEWLTIQNPLQRFGSNRTPLPGQKSPGMGLGHKVIDLFVYLSRINRNDGILAFPAYLHNALLFSRAFHFLNPDKEAEVRAVRTSFPEVTFKELAWIVHLDCVVEEGKGFYKWKAEEQVYPLSRPIKLYFESSEYRTAIKQSAMTKKFSIDSEKYSRKKEEMLAENLDGNFID